MTTMAPGWAERIAAAQLQATEEIRGETHRRIPYGQDFPDGAETCRDCGVERGQWHVIGCCVERCARCKTGQAMCCAACGLDA